MLCNKNTGWNSENVISSAALQNPILPSLNGYLILTTAEVNWSLICRHIFKQRLLFCKDYSASQSIVFYSSHREAYAGLGRGAASCNSLSKGDKILSYTASVASHYIDLWQCYTFLQQKAQNIFFLDVAQHLLSMTHDKTHTCSDSPFLKLKSLTIFRGGTVRPISTYKTWNQ